MKKTSFTFAKTFQRQVLVNTLKTVFTLVALLVGNFAFGQVGACDPGSGNTVSGCPAVGPVTVTVDGACNGIVPDLRTGVSGTAGAGFLDFGPIQNPIAGSVLSGTGNKTVKVANTFIDPATMTLCAVYCSDVTLSFVDNIAPQITCIAPITVDVDANCELVLDSAAEVLQFVPTLSDNCTAQSSISLSVDVNNDSSVESYPVTLNGPSCGTPAGPPSSVTLRIIATDASGNTASCISTPTLRDNTPPSATCPGNQVVPVSSAFGACNASTPNFTSLVTGISDNCDGGPTYSTVQSPVPGTILGLPTSCDTLKQPTAITVYDCFGNGFTCNFTMLFVDTTAPVITGSCPPTTVTLYADSNCDVNIPDLTAGIAVQDNCSNIPNGSLTLTQSPIGIVNKNGLCPGANTIDISFTPKDCFENTGTPLVCTALVTVLDTVSPVVVCPAAPIPVPIPFDPFTCEHSIATVTLADAIAAGVTVDDNCDSSATLGSVLPNMFMCPDMGKAGLTVTITALDCFGNTDTSVCAVTVIPDVDQVADWSLGSSDYIVCPSDFPLTLVPGPNTPGCGAWSGDLSVSMSGSGVGTGSWSGTIDASSVPDTDGDGLPGPGVFSLTYTVGSYSCHVSETHNIIISPTFVAGDAALVADDTVCWSATETFDLEGLLATGAVQGGAFSVATTGNLSGQQIGNLFQYTGGDGNLIVTYSLADCDGNLVSDQVVISVDEKPDGHFTLPAAVCQDAGVLIPVVTDVPFGANISFASTPAGFITNSLTGAFNPAAGLLPGESVTVQVTMTVVNGVCANHVNTQIVVVSASGDPSFTVPATICESDADLALSLASLLSDNGTNPLIASNVNWTGTSVTDNGTTGSFDPSVGPGTYTICVTVGAPSCEETICRDITVIEDYTAEEVALTSDYSLCIFKDDVIDFSSLLAATAKPGGVFTAVQGGGLSGGIINPNGYVYKGSCGTLTVTYSFPGDCVPSSDQIVITIEEKPDAGNLALAGPLCAQDAPITITYSGTPSVCGANGVFSGTGVTNGGNGTSAIFTPATAGEGTHTITYKIGNPATGCYSETTGSIEVRASSSPNFTVPGTACANEVVNLALSSPNPSVLPGSPDSNVEITWLGGDGVNAIVTDNGNGTGTFVGKKAGTYTVCVITGDLGCTQYTCRQITVDNVAPVLSCGPQVRTRSNATDLCTYTAAGTEFNVTATDNCVPPNGASSLVLTHNYAPHIGTNANSLAGAVFPVGTTQIVWTARDTAGNTASCTIQIQVNDTELPTVTSCPANIAQGTDADICGAQVSYATPQFEDNCDGTGLEGVMISGLTSGSDFPLGVTTVTWTYSDLADNGTATCTFTVTITDNDAPVAVCQSAITLSLDGDGEALLTADDVDLASYDNCGIVNTVISHAGSTFDPSHLFTCTDLGANTVTLRVTDAAGNSTTCTSAITVVDNQVPDIECSPNIVTFNNAGLCSAVVIYPAPTVTENCANTVTQIDGTGLTSGSAFPVGTTVQTYRVVDAAGNTETCSFTVQVLDNEKPVLSCTPLVRARTTDAGVCNYTTVGAEFNVTATDNCAVTSLVHDYAPQVGTNAGSLAGAVFPTGVTEVVWTATDAAGNTHNCTVQIEVTDDEAPTVQSCPANIAQGTDADDCGAEVTYVTPQFQDNCDGTNLEGVLVAGYASGTHFHVGTTTVTWTYADLAGNGTATCTFTVTISDDDAPVAVCQPSIDVVLDGDGIAQLTADDVDLGSYDNCSSTLTRVISHAGSSFAADHHFDCTDLGAQTVTLSLTDDAGNVSTCTSNVTVLDLQVPDIECSSNIYVGTDAGACSAVVTYPAPTATDNCATTVTLTSGLASGSTFPSGTTTQVFTAVDAAGNSESCSFTVTVSDYEAPVINCAPTVRTVFADAGQCSFTVAGAAFDATFTDNCPGGFLAHNYATAAGAGTLAGSTFPVGTTLVTWQATDASGYVSDICGIQIVVLDNQAPSITCGSNVTVNADPGLCSFKVTSTAVDPAFSDNCAGASISHNYASAPSANTANGAVFPVGNTIVTWTAKDASGNTASCSYTVTVVDNQDPLFLNCPTTMVMIGNDPGQCSGKLNWAIPVATDNCGIASVAQTGGPASGTTFNVGAAQNITYTATDVNGRTKTCVFQVQVVDTEKPNFDADIVMPTNITVQCNAIPSNCVFHGNGICSPLVSGDVNDNCTANITPVYNQVSTQGASVNNCNYYNYTLTRTWTLTDAAGNSRVHTQVITVVDNTAPAPVCQNTTVTLDKTGNGSINPVSQAVGTTDVCAPFSALAITASKTAFNCSNLGANNVTLTITDPCGNSSTCGIVVTVVEGVGSCTPGATLASSCLSNATTLTNGQFSERITIKALAMQTWTVTSSNGLFTSGSAAPPAAPTAVSNGTLFVAGNLDGIDNDGLNGPDDANEMVYYTLNAKYVEAIGYSATLTNNIGQTLTISNVAHYPTPMLVDFFDPFCYGTDPFVPQVVDQFAGAGAYTSVSFLVDGVPVTQVNPSALSLGQHTLTIIADGGPAAYSRKVNGNLVAGDAADSDAARLNPGCVQSTTVFFTVVTTPAQVTCNDQVHVTLEGDCSSIVTSDMVLEGSYPCFDDYEVRISLPNGVPLSPANQVTAAHAGLNLNYVLWHPISGNTCWGHVSVEDLTDPTVSCPSNKVILCVEDPDALLANGQLATGIMSVTDCSSWTWEYTDDYTSFDCAANPGVAEIITRTFVVTDEFGNQGSCTQTITKQRGEVSQITLPGDPIYACNDPLLNTLAPAFSPAVTGWPKIGGVNLTTSGTGICGLGVSYTDEVVNICAASYKVVRTWKVFDWCPASGSAPTVVTHVQYIKVENVAPTVTVNCQTVNSQGYCVLNATEPGNPPHVQCSAIFIPAADVDGGCDGIKEITVETPAGNTTNGGLVPAPGLPIGGPYEIIYRAEDLCGNITEYVLTVVVEDQTAPVAVCDQVTDVNLSSDGVAEVFAATYDDGSYDGCCLNTFAVRKMVDNCADNHNDLEFGPSVYFCCEDIGAPAMVVFRAYDCNGNFNDCMVSVTVNDKQKPIVVSCPSNQRTNCDFYANDLELQLGNLAGNAAAQSQLLDQYFGAPEFIDNCDFTVNRTFSANIDQCLEGTITRSWTAVDPSGNASTACSQTVFVDHVSDWVIEFPADLTVNCGTTVPDFGEPEIFSETCELVGVSYVDQVFTVVTDACYKIERKWTVINWCVVGAEIDQEVVEASEQAMNLDLDGDGDKDSRTFRDSWTVSNKPAAAQANVSVGPDTDTDSDPWDGYITYNQVIKVNDTVDPVFTNGCQIPDVCIEDNSCAATVILPQPAITECSPSVTFTVNSALGSGFGPFINVGPGVYSVTYTAKDNCNNQTACTATVTVKDCKKPTPYCVNGLVVELGLPGTLVLSTSSFNAGSYDNCTPQSNLKYSFSANTNATTLTVGCDELGQNVVQLWVTDAAGNQDYCETFVEVQDNMNVCDPSGNPLISGLIHTEDDENVSDVDVQLSGAAQSSFMTTNAGTFNFNVVAGNDYTVTPVKDNDPLNGVTTFDLVLITKHILGAQLLDSPYKIIAADANKSNSVTTFDLVQLRKLILFIDTTFPNNTSWRFVESGYVFPDPTNPWSAMIPEVANINDIAANQTAVDFVAVKVGDVNGSAQTNFAATGDDRNATGSLVFNVDEAALNAGDVYTVDFKAGDFDVFGYQFTLNFDASVLEFVQVNSAVARAENFGLTMLDKGVITTSWNDNDTRLAKDEVVFSLVFKANANVMLSDVLSVNSRYTAAEAYKRNGELLDVQLAFNGVQAAGNFALYQNTPNPFSVNTVVGFNLPAACTATLTITDVSGKVVKMITGDYAKGYNEIRLERRELPSSGILYYQLDTPSDSATKMMLLMD
jgi:hypothetical protein